VANLLFIAALALAKLSVVWFLARLTPSSIYVRLCTGMAALCAAWGTGGVLALALRCDLAEPWIIIGAKCPNLVSLRILSLMDLAAHKHTATPMAADIRL
jgi:hypothetical protein